MKLSWDRLLHALAVPAIAALGGGFAVFAGYDDAPGGVLLGLMLVAGAAALSWKGTRREG